MPIYFLIYFIMSDLLSLFVESFVKTQAKTKTKSGKSTSIKTDSYYFTRVNSKYESMITNQRDFYGTPTLEVKKMIVERCVSLVEESGYSKKLYLSRLRDTMMDFVLNLAFLMECQELGLDPFVTAQNMVVCYKHRKALKDGIAIVFKDKLDLLKEPLFTEAELADAKFNNVEGFATKRQKTQLSTLIERAMNILPEPEEESQDDSND